jgi:DNA-binding NtrC family response regulator
LEGAVIRAEANGHTCIEADDLPMEMQIHQLPSDQTIGVFPIDGLNMDEAKARFELQCIEQAFRQTRARKTEAARILGLNDRFALRRRLKSLFRRYPHLFEEFPLARQAVEGR